MQQDLPGGINPEALTSLRTHGGTTIYVVGDSGILGNAPFCSTRNDLGADSEPLGLRGKLVLVYDPDELRVGVSTHDQPCVLIDMGAEEFLIGSEGRPEGDLYLVGSDDTIIVSISNAEPAKPTADKMEAALLGHYPAGHAVRAS